jgi:hypothetical protein
MPARPRWSDRRRRTLLGLGLAAVGGGLGALGLPDVYGVTSGFLAVLAVFLLVAAVAVFVIVPGPGTLGVLLETVPLAGASFVVAVLLLLSTPPDLRWLWTLGTVATAAWTAYALWRARSRGV